MKKIKIRFRLLRLDKGSYHPLCIVRVNNKKARLIMDTGASRTIMDSNRIFLFADKKNVKKHDELSTGLGTSTMESSAIELNLLEIGEVQLKKFEMVLLDLSHLNNTYSKVNIKPVDGILGNDILKKLGAIISFPAKTITISAKK